MSDESVHACGVLNHLSNAIRFHDPVANIVDGVVHYRHRGLVHTLVRIHVGRGVALHVKLPIDDAGCFIEGRRVTMRIPAEAIRLEAGLFRRSRQRLNRWYGRIVLVTSHREERVITAKIYGEGWSLTSAIPIVGSVCRVQTWDPVNIVVDPHAIELAPTTELA